MCRVFILFFTVKSCSIQHPDDLRSASIIGYTALIEIIKCCNSIIDETITVQELTTYREKKNQLELICNGANSGKTKLCPEFSKTSASMDLSFRKYTDAKEYLSKMKVLVEYCRPISNGMYMTDCMI